MVFPYSFDLLQQEGHLIHSCLTYGLTALRHSRVDQKGQFYTAFFQLSIGLERLMKTNLVIAHMARHKFASPTKKELQSFGHDLLSLFEACKQIKIPSTSSQLDVISPGTIAHEIVSFLGEFAKSTRYFNLDGLAHPIRQPIRLGRGMVSLSAS
jgi:hypothetical protein